MMVPMVEEPMAARTPQSSRRQQRRHPRANRQRHLERGTEQRRRRRGPRGGGPTDHRPRQSFLLWSTTATRQRG
jgi:hypothetical protein